MTRAPLGLTGPGAPTRDLETQLLASGYQRVAGMDEVGRGALAGPVSVGLVVVDITTGAHPEELRDSKLLRPEARHALVTPVQQWCRSFAVGHATPAEIDEHGLTAALRLAGRRALTAVTAHGMPPDVVVLDGHHDWLSPRSLFEEAGDLVEPPEVITQIKADLSCAAVAGASVLAKCERDTHMIELARRYPHFGWESNKGYAAPEHIAGLQQHGPCREHRRSWRLPGVVRGANSAAELTASVTTSGRIKGE